jgi:hypothetical protein
VLPPTVVRFDNFLWDALVLSMGSDSSAFGSGNVVFRLDVDARGNALVSTAHETRGSNLPYLEAETKEKVYIIGGPGFGELEGHTLIIHKALYGLRSSDLRWHERFANTLRDMGF